MTTPLGPTMKRVHVIAATGRSGQALCRALMARGIDVVPVVRNPGKFGATALPDRKSVV